MATEPIPDCSVAWSLPRLAAANSILGTKVLIRPPGSNRQPGESELPGLHIRAGGLLPNSATRMMAPHSKMTSPSERYAHNRVIVIESRHDIP